MVFMLRFQPLKVKSLLYLYFCCSDAKIEMGFEKKRNQYYNPFFRCKGAVPDKKRAGLNMGKFITKMIAIAVIIVGLIVLVKVGKFVSSGIQQATDFEKDEKLAQEQEDTLQAELAEAEQKAKEAQAREQVQQRYVKPSTKPPEPQPEELPIEDQIQAEKLYQMALTEFKIARKPLMTYHRMVRYCRELLEKYPDSPEAAKARVLLRKMPERERKRHKITDEEMEL